MAQYFNPQAYNAQHTFQSAPSAQNLQFFPSTYPSTPGHTTPAPPAYDPYHTPAPSAYQMGAGGASGPIGGGVGYGRESFDSGTGGISGRMGEAGGLRTGWLAAFGTEGYEGEPPLLEELGINFDHIRMKVRAKSFDVFSAAAVVVLRLTGLIMLIEISFAVLLTFPGM